MKRTSNAERIEMVVARRQATTTSPEGEAFSEWLRRIARGQGPRPAARGLTLTHAELMKMAEASQVWREALRVTLEGRKA